MHPKDILEILVCSYVHYLGIAYNPQLEPCCVVSNGLIKTEQKRGWIILLLFLTGERHIPTPLPYMVMEELPGYRINDIID